MLKFLRLEELSLKKRALDINIILYFIKLFLLEVERSFLLQDFLAFNLQLLARLLDLNRRSLKLNLLLLQIDQIFLKLLPIGVDKFSLLLKQALLAA